MFLNYKYPTYLAFSAVSVFLFDRYRYAYMFDENKNFLNEVLQGEGAFPGNAEAHFRTLAMFDNIETALYIFAIFAGFALIKSSKMFHSFAVVSGIFLVGAIVGRMFSRTEPLRIEFFQTYLVATVATGAILCAAYVLKKRKVRGPN